MIRLYSYTVISLAVAVAALSARAEFSRLTPGEAAITEAESAPEQPGANEIAVPPMTVRGLGTYAGQNLSIYFVSGTEGPISTSGQTLAVRAVMRDPVTLPIPAGGEVRVPALSTPKTSGFFAFSHVLYVVHRAPKYALRNANGKAPRGVDEADAADDQLAFEKKFHLLHSELVDRKGVVDAR